MDEQNKNLILATVLSFIVIVGWTIIFPPADPVPTPIAEDQSANQSAVAPQTKPLRQPLLILIKLRLRPVASTSTRLNYPDRFLFLGVALTT